MNNQQEAKIDYIREMAEDDFECGHPFDPDDFDEFKKKRRRRYRRRSNT